MANKDFSRTIDHSQGGSGFSRSSALFARAHLDLPLLLLLLLLAACGLLILYSGSGRSIDMVERQVLHFLLGFGVLLAAAQFPPRFYQQLAPFAYSIGVILLAGVLLFGVGAKGAQRWLEFPGLPRFQPSELMKLALPLMVAWYMAKRPVPPKLSDIVKALIILLLPVVMILKQPDLGTSILIATAGLLVVFFCRHVVAADRFSGRSGGRRRPGDVAVCDARLPETTGADLSESGV